MPTRNPFDREKQPELAQDWGHAYVTVTAAPPRKPLTASAGADPAAATVCRCVGHVKGTTLF